MNPFRRRESLILLLGDIFFFMVSLWVSLVVRNATIPSENLFNTHLKAFGFLFIIWIVIFHIAGLYEKRTLLLRFKLPGILFNTQLINSGVAVAFFYLIPYFGITPKTLLFIYLLTSFIIVLLWRMYGYFFIGARQPTNALIVGSGGEMRELMDEVAREPLHNIRFVSSIDLDKVENKSMFDEIISRVYAEDVTLVAIDLMNPKVEPVLPHLYNLIFSKVSFVDMHRIYEDIFDRVPLSLLRYNWFLENVSTSPSVTYDALKRLMDFSIALVFGIVSLIMYPFVWLAIKFDDGGPLFSFQRRVGHNNKIVNLAKFRTMNIANDEGKWSADLPINHITRVGKFLRETRIDELPQLWNVVRGDISLIGPRPEFPDPVKEYSREIPYYNIRHIIKPGLSGWAQIYHEAHPHHTLDVAETKNKLSYDLYYIKNRSFLLDLSIALRTIRTLLSRAGK